MTGKKYLNQLLLCRNVINNDVRRLDELKELALATGSKELKKDVVQKSLKNAGLEDTVGEYVDFELKIIEEVKHYQKLKEKILQEIYHMDSDVKYIELLILRYSQGQRFEEIATNMGYSFGRVTHMHIEALEKFENSYKEMLEEWDERRLCEFCETGK